MKRGKHLDGKKHCHSLSFRQKTPGESINASWIALECVGRIQAMMVLVFCGLLSFVFAAPAYAVCANPAGNKAEIIWNNDQHVLQYCDDTNWIAMGRRGSDSQPQEPTDPKIIDTDQDLTNMDSPLDVGMKGDYLFVTASVSDKFNVYDISDRTSPVYVTSITHADLDNASRMTVYGDYAYVIATGKLVIVDLTPLPAAPTVAGSLAISNPYNVVVQGDYAYVVGSTGVSVVDVQNKASPSVVGSVDVPGNEGAGIAVQGRYVYVGSTPGMYVVDVDTLSTPEIVGSTAFSYSGAADCMVLHKGFLYATYDYGAYTVNVSDSFNPINLSSWMSTGAYRANKGCAVYEDYLLLTSSWNDGGGELRIIDISSPTSMPHLGAVADNTYLRMSGGSGGGLTGEYPFYYVAAHVNDYLTTVALTGYCYNPAGLAGDIIYNDDENQMQFCNGKDWASMGNVAGGGGGGCTSPVGAESDMIYNDDFAVMQYCNGTDWVGIGKK